MNHNTVANVPYNKQNELNPLGISGVEFVEYGDHQKKNLDQLFTRMGFAETLAVHGKNIHLYEQGDLHFILNCEANTFAAEFSKKHGPSICSVGFRVFNAQLAFKEAVKRGAHPVEEFSTTTGIIWPFPAVYGIGQSIIYFMDRENTPQLYFNLFQKNSGEIVLNKEGLHEGCGLRAVDHFTNNVPKGDLQKWCNFYSKVFNFKEVRTFDIRGKQTGLYSKVMRSPCGTFSIPINEPTEAKSQIQEYLDEYKGSGIQHLALVCTDIISTLNILKSSSIEFLSPPPKTYYAQLKDRLPNVVEDLTQLQNHAILVDGDPEGYLLQIFTKNVIGPIFYEIIQRKNHFGFGEGNFQALFDAMEQDQRERGYL